MRFKCDQCPYTAQHQCRIREHSLTAHSENRPWKCPHPGCTYSGKINKFLVRHSRTHLDAKDRPYRCENEGCEHGASTLADLKSHILARHTVGRTRDFECPLCPSRFYRRDHVKVHILTHVKEKSFECSQCNFRTYTNAKLQNHIRVVHEKIQFKCSAPGCTFSTCWSRCLKDHYRNIHSPDEADRHPFQCNFPSCHFRASYRYSLNQHVQSRHNSQRTKEMTCQLCGKSYYTQSGVNLHMRTLHLKEKGSGKSKNYSPQSSTEVTSGMTPGMTPVVLLQRIYLQVM